MQWSGQSIIGRLPAGQNIDSRVLYQIPHPRRGDIRHLLPGAPRPAPTTSPPRRLCEVLFIRVVCFAERAVGLAGACCAFRIVYVDQRPIGVVNGAPLLISDGAPRGRQRL